MTAQERERFYNLMERIRFRRNVPESFNPDTLGMEIVEKYSDYQQGDEFWNEITVYRNGIVFVAGWWVERNDGESAYHGGTIWMDSSQRS